MEAVLSLIFTQAIYSVILSEVLTTVNTQSRDLSMQTMLVVASNYPGMQKGSKFEVFFFYVTVKLCSKSVMSNINRLVVVMDFKC